MESQTLKSFNDVSIEHLIRDLSLMDIAVEDYKPAIREVLSKGTLGINEEDITHIWLIRKVLKTIDEKKKGG